MSLSESLKPSVPKRKGIFPGWWLIPACGFLFGWASGPINLGIVMKTLQAQFGWGRAQISLAASLGRVEGGFDGIFQGLATDKWGPRAVALVSITMFGLALCAMYFINSLWLFFVIWIVVATGHNAAYQGNLDKAVADWFARRRGLMNAIMRSINSGLNPVSLLIVSWLLYTYGWREAYVIAGVITLVTGLPLAWFFIKPHRPEYYGWLPDGKRIAEELATDTEAAIKAGVEYATEATGEVEFTLRQALRDRAFWIYLLMVAARTLAFTTVLLHLIPHLTDMGLVPAVAAGVLGMSTAMQIPGRILTGWLGDRIRITRLKYLGVLGLLLMGCGMLILTQAKSLTILWGFVVVYGFGYGACVAFLTPLRGRFWGRKAYATIQGTAQTITMPVAVAAPVYAGWVFDTTGSYTTVFIASFIILLLGAAIVAFFLNPPKQPEKIGKVTEFF
ncbi:MFS transporter [Chloroflexota bacterium]